MDISMEETIMKMSTSVSNREQVKSEAQYLPKKVPKSTIWPFLLLSEGEFIVIIVSEICKLI